MSDKQEYRDEIHRPFGVLLASKPPAEKGRASSTVVSLVIHGLAGFGLIWATMAMAEEVTEEEDQPVLVELVTEVEVPPPPPPPPPPDMPVPAAVETVFQGFQTLEIPPVIPPDIPPPSTMTQFNAADFSGEGVQGGRAGGVQAPPDVSSVEPTPDTPTFTPMTVRPRLTNQREVEQALIREYPPILRDAGIGGTVVIWAFINEEGIVESVQANKPSGYSQLDEAALKVGRVMKFTPAYNRDQKVKVWVEIPVTFRIG